MQFNLQFLTARREFSQWLSKEADKHDYSWREEGKREVILGVQFCLFLNKGSYNQ